MRPRARSMIHSNEHLQVKMKGLTGELHDSLGHTTAFTTDSSLFLFLCLFVWLFGFCFSFNFLFCFLVFVVLFLLFYMGVARTEDRCVGR